MKDRVIVVSVDDDLAFPYYAISIDRNLVGRGKTEGEALKDLSLTIVESSFSYQSISHKALSYKSINTELSESAELEAAYLFEDIKEVEGSKVESRWNIIFDCSPPSRLLR